MIPHPTALPMAAPESFDRLAQVCERIAAASGRNEKISLLAEYLRTLGIEDQRRALRFLGARPVETKDGRKLALGHTVLREALVQACGHDLDLIRLCYRETGDTGETISLLMNDGQGPPHKPFALADAEQRYLRIYQKRLTTERVAILAGTYRELHPLTLRYFVKVITGAFRIGLQDRLLEEAFAAAAGVPAAQIREACNKTGDLAAVAEAVARGELETIAVRLFHPMDFMLAKPLEESPGVGDDPSQWVVEDKYDGIRAQIHASGGEVRIFTRGREDATAAFPEIAAAFSQLPHAIVADGEILAWRDGRALPFQALQKRIARKRVSEAVRREVPLHFIAYDLLYLDGGLLLEQPWEERRALLESTGLDTSPRAPLTDIDVQFAAARARGNEGLLLKRRASVYEPGKRSGQWLKVKRAFATLDVVITAAEQGSGRRATLLSDYTFAVRNDEGAFVNIGKAYSGLADDEIRELTRRLRAITTDRYGSRVFVVKPEVVLEVAFDGIQTSSRHKSGFALRFPRIVRWRLDKTPAECDTLETVRRLHEAGLSGV